MIQPFKPVLTHITWSNSRITELSETESISDGGVRLDMTNLASALEESLEETIADDTTSASEQGRESQPQSKKEVNQSVILLPPIPVTHAQVAAAVRGGTLLQIYIQRFSNQVNVTFARAEDAATFIEYAQSAPFYVAQRLVSSHLLTPPALIITSHFPPAKTHILTLLIKNRQPSNGHHAHTSPPNMPSNKSSTAA